MLLVICFVNSVFIFFVCLFVVWLLCSIVYGLVVCWFGFRFVLVVCYNAFWFVWLGMVGVWLDFSFDLLILWLYCMDGLVVEFVIVVAIACLVICDLFFCVGLGFTFCCFEGVVNSVALVDAVVFSYLVVGWLL